MKKILLFLFFLIGALQANAAQEQTLILLDSSVSMMEAFGETPKYLLAVNETKKVLSKYDDRNEIGLRTIGISIENAMDFLTGDTESFCKATRLVSPISKNNTKNINSSLDLVFPLGTTPLTYSLQQSINYDFDKNAYKHIILITDGGESCNADPCSYIRGVMSSRSDIKIDVIAIGVSGKEQSDLNCLASATSGELFNVRTPDDLSTALNKFLKNSTIVPSLNNPNIKEKIKESIPKVINNEPQIKYKNYLLVE